LLLIAGGYLFVALERSLTARDHSLLASKAQVLRLLLRQHPEDTGFLASEVEHETADSPLRYFLRVLDTEGRTLLETPEMTRLIPSGAFPDPVSGSTDLAAEIAANTRSHGPFLLVATTASLGKTAGELRTLQLALDVSARSELLADYRTKLLLVLGFGIVFAAFAGEMAARRGLQPLVQITQTARQITARHLDERITPSEWPVELSELATAFNLMLDRLEESFNRLSECAADLAHELRTPINNLRGEAEVALGRCRTAAEYQQVLASSLEEFDRISRMIEEMLFLARTEDPRAAIDRQPFAARGELEAIREFFEPLAAEKEVELLCEGQASILGDRGLFRRALSNLVSNALRHTAPRGRVQLQLRAGAGHVTEVLVVDSGSGIAPEHLPRIFDRFYRPEASRSGIPGGTGLGLPIVASIMRLHGGTLDVASTPGQGTTVALRFPAAD
jgi:two-component system heavy metal sensor histidine kinase CusS